MIVIGSRCPAGHSGLVALPSCVDFHRGFASEEERDHQTRTHQVGVSLPAAAGCLPGGSSGEGRIKAAAVESFTLGVFVPEQRASAKQTGPGKEGVSSFLLVRRIRSSLARMKYKYTNNMLVRVPSYYYRVTHLRRVKLQR